LPRSAAEPARECGTGGGDRGPVEVLVIIGGDGTVHRAPRTARVRDLHLPRPAGKENPSPASSAWTPARDAAGCFVRPRVRDVGLCNGVPFALMRHRPMPRSSTASPGPRVRHLSYLRPIASDPLHSPRSRSPPTAARW
jgi:hypothetical protein